MRLRLPYLIVLLSAGIPAMLPIEIVHANDCLQSTFDIVFSNVPDDTHVFSGDVLTVTSHPLTGHSIVRAEIRVGTDAPKLMDGEELTRVHRDELSRILDLRIAAKGSHIPGEISLDTGTVNPVAISLFDANGNCGKNQISLSMGRAQTFALLIGVNASAATQNTLQYARADAEGMAQHLVKNGAAAEDIRLLTDDITATTHEIANIPALADVSVGMVGDPEGVSDEIGKMLDKADTNATAVFYFSGHEYATDMWSKDPRSTAGHYYLVLPKSTLQKQSSLLDLALLANDLAVLSTRMHVVAIIDACYSGEVLVAFQHTGSKPPSGAKVAWYTYLGHAPKPPFGVDAQLFSTSANDYSFEFASLQHGVFTHFLLKAEVTPQDSHGGLRLPAVFDDAQSKTDAFVYENTHQEFHQVPEAKFSDWAEHKFLWVSGQ
jgi:Caspase domain